MSNIRGQQEEKEVKESILVDLAVYIDGFFVKMNLQDKFLTAEIQSQVKIFDRQYRIPL